MSISISLSLSPYMCVYIYIYTYILGPLIRRGVFSQTPVVVIMNISISVNLR